MPAMYNNSGVFVNFVNVLLIEIVFIFVNFAKKVEPIVSEEMLGKMILEITQEMSCLRTSIDMLGNEIANLCNVMDREKPIKDE